VADTVDFVFYGLYDPTNAPTAYDTTSNDCDYYNTGTDCIKSAFTGNSNMMYGAVGLGGIAVVAALLGRKVRDNISLLCSSSFPINLTLLIAPIETTETSKRQYERSPVERCSQ
jgi:hypothetical protein